MAKAKKPTRGKAVHTWKVTRRNNQSVDITAETLGVVDGDLVFSMNGVTSRVISADTYNHAFVGAPIVMVTMAIEDYGRCACAWCTKTFRLSALCGPVDL